MKEHAWHPRAKQFTYSASGTVLVVLKAPGSQPSQAQKGMMMLVPRRTNNHLREETSILRFLPYSTNTLFLINCMGLGFRKLWYPIGLNKIDSWGYVMKIPRWATSYEASEKQVLVTSWPRHAWRTQMFPSSPWMKLWLEVDLPGI